MVLYRTTPSLLEYKIFNILIINVVLIDGDASGKEN